MGSAKDMPETHVEDASPHVLPPDVNNEMSMSIWETIKANPKTISWCCTLASGPMVYGFDLIIVSQVVAMPAFQRSFGTLVGAKYIIPSMWLALWNSMIQVGAMAGALVSGGISDRFGRRTTFVFGAIVTAIATAVIYFSDYPANRESRRVMFLMGKIIAGLAFGLITPAYLTIISEIAPSRLRGPLVSCFTFFTVMAQLVGVGLVRSQVKNVHPSAYHRVFASQWALAGVAVIAGICIPESPIYLIKRNCMDKALKSYQRLYTHEDPEARIAALQTVVEHELMAEKNQDSVSYVQCFKGTNLRRTRIVIFANVAQQLVGITFIINMTYFLQLGGMDPALAVNMNLIKLAIGIVFLFGTFWTMTWFGRRTLMLVGSAVAVVFWIAVGVAGCFSSPEALLFIGIGMIIVYEAYALSVGAVYPVIASEASSVRLRAVSNSIGFVSQFFASWLFGFTVPYMFGADAGDLGGKCGFIFAGLSLICYVITWIDVPETKNRTYAELDEMYEMNLPTRQFKNFVCTGIQVPYLKSEDA
ncbi:general substrate transporter [Cadophora sp. MPI-SDFR-AT-0126]|nr:general substrate transporter [Leotiomycetes sp. MPI-SDFR-AT-0126]